MGHLKFKKIHCFDSITFHFALLDLGHFLFLVQVGEYFYETLKVKTKTLLSFIAEPMYYNKKTLAAVPKPHSGFKWLKPTKNKFTLCHFTNFSIKF